MRLQPLRGSRLAAFIPSAQSVSLPKPNAITSWAFPTLNAVLDKYFSG